MLLLDSEMVAPWAGAAADEIDGTLRRCADYRARRVNTTQPPPGGVGCVGVSEPHRVVAKESATVKASVPSGARRR